MQVDSVIRGIVAASGRTLVDVSIDLGRSSAWASNVGRAGRSPALATVAEIADALGYEVAIIDRASGEVVARVDPPTRGGDQ